MAVWMHHRHSSILAFDVWRRECRCKKLRNLEVTELFNCLWITLPVISSDCIFFRVCRTRVSPKGTIDPRHLNNTSLYTEAWKAEDTHCGPYIIIREQKSSGMSLYQRRSDFINIVDDELSLLHLPSRVILDGAVLFI